MNTEVSTEAKNNRKHISLSDRKDMIAIIVTFIAICGFAAFVILLTYLLSSNSISDIQWDRFIYLLTGIETITFTTIGWLFGKEVYRREAEQAEKQMEVITEQSKQQEAEMRQEITQAWKNSNDEKEKAYTEKEHTHTERERGYALFRAIQQLAQAQNSRKFARERLIDSFGFLLFDLDTDNRQRYPEISREFAVQLELMTESDLAIVVKLANELYPELKSSQPINF